MAYLLWVKDEVETEIRQLPGHIRQRIRKSIQQLRQQPRPSSSISMGIKIEIHFEVRRIRMDSWRVIYVIDEEFSEIGILAVRKRPPYDYADLENLLAGLN